MPPATPSTDELRKLESEDFSLVLGGPLFQLWRRSRLSDEVGNMPHRRAAAAVLIAWVPLLLLSLVEGRAWGRIELPFLRDLELHARLLVAMPLLILAELVVHRRMRLVVRQFVEDGLIPDASRSRVRPGRGVRPAPSQFAMGGDPAGAAGLRHRRLRRLAHAPDARCLELV